MRSYSDELKRCITLNTRWPTTDMDVSGGMLKSDALVAFRLYLACQSKTYQNQTVMIYKQKERLGIPSNHTDVVALTIDILWSSPPSFREARGVEVRHFLVSPWNIHIRYHASYSQPARSVLLWLFESLRPTCCPIDDNFSSFAICIHLFAVFFLFFFFLALSPTVLQTLLSLNIIENVHIS